MTLTVDMTRTMEVDPQSDPETYRQLAIAALAEGLGFEIDWDSERGHTVNAVIDPLHGEIDQLREEVISEEEIRQAQGVPLPEKAPLPKQSSRKVISPMPSDNAIKGLPTIGF